MKVPTNAKRVFKGIIFDVYQWQQKMFDNSVETFEMIKRPNTIEVIAVNNNKIMISHQSQPTKKDFYSLFGGRAEANEDTLTTAKRELLEESGLASNDLELFIEHHPDPKIDYTIYTYIARDCKKISNPKLDAGEKIEVIELTFNEFVDIVLSDKYWGNDLALDILRMKDRGELDKFKEKLLG